MAHRTDPDGIALYSAYLWHSLALSYRVEKWRQSLTLDAIELAVRPNLIALCVQAHPLRRLLKGAHSHVPDGYLHDVPMRCVCLHEDCRKSFYRPAQELSGVRR